MPVYHYTASIGSREDFSESGTILANSAEEATRKLKLLRFDKIRLKRVEGLAALLGRWTATIK